MLFDFSSHEFELALHYANQKKYDEYPDVSNPDSELVGKYERSAKEALKLKALTEAENKSGHIMQVEET